MKIESQPLEGHQIKLNVEIGEDQLKEAERRAAVKLAKRIKIPGFRPGKAPYPVVVRTVGEAAIFEEALGIIWQTRRIHCMLGNLPLNVTRKRIARRLRLLAPG